MPGRELLLTRFVSIFIFGFSSLLLNVAQAASVIQVSLERPEGTRTYWLGVPQTSSAQPPDSKRPLVLLLHGHMGSGAQVLGRERIAAPLAVWLDIADREQLVVIAPDGVNGGDGKAGWNDCRADASGNPKTDDLGFLSALIDKAIADYAVDPARVYVMGMSNGGMMSFRLASEIGSRLAGFATIGATMAAKSVCPAPSTPVSALIIHGTDDPIVPYAGGEVKIPFMRGRGSIFAVEQSVAVWRKVNGVSDNGVETLFAHLQQSDPTHARRTVWGDDTHKLQVALIKIEGGGHTEPSPTRRIQWIYRTVLGEQSGDLEAAEEAWSFFKDKRAGLRP